MSGAKLWRRIWNTLAAVTVTQADDTGPVMLLQLKIGYIENNDMVPAVQQFGFASVPPLQSDGVAAFVGGDRSNGVVIGTNNQGARFKGKQPGESVVHNGFGVSIYLAKTGLVIDGGGMNITINNAPTVTQNGDLNVTGEIRRGFGTGAEVTLGGHEHTSEAVGTPTSPPIAGH
jgi:phage baseplate assembly protein V